MAFYILSDENGNCYGTIEDGEGFNKRVIESLNLYFTDFTTSGVINDKSLFHVHFKDGSILEFYLEETCIFRRKISKEQPPQERLPLKNLHDLWVHIPPYLCKNGVDLNIDDDDEGLITVTAYNVENTDGILETKQEDFIRLVEFTYPKHESAQSKASRIIIEEDGTYLLNNEVVTICNLREGVEATEFTMVKTDGSGLDWEATCFWRNDDINEEFEPIES